jgi:glycosyltransferase involved in cell wall biosynthesis
MMERDWQIYPRPDQSQLGRAIPAAMTPINVGFVLLSNSRRPIPSTRIAALNMFPFLRAANFAPQIVFDPHEDSETPNIGHLAPRLLSEGFQIIVFQKVHGPSVEKLARELSAAGIKTVYSVCDRVNPAMTAATDVTITVTEYLKSRYPHQLRQKIRVVHDGIEQPDARKTTWRGDRGSRAQRLRAVLVTSHNLDRLPLIAVPPEWLEVTIVGRYSQPTDAWRPLLREARWKLAGFGWRESLAYLKFRANPRIRCLPWDSVGVYATMQQSDIGIIPVEATPELEPEANVPGWMLKSENRLTMKMCVGLPVIATPLPAYEDVIEHGWNGFFARSPHDWFKYLEALRDPTTRRTIGDRARESVLASFSREEQARRLIAVLRDLVPSGRVDQRTLEK